MHARYRRICLALAVMTASLCAAAHELSKQECRELAEFLKHAAMSRDSGYEEAFIMTRLQDDLETIRAFPPALRWIAQDPDDEAMLIEATREVFRSPVEPQLHESRFLDWCSARFTLLTPEPPR